MSSVTVSVHDRRSVALLPGDLIGRAPGSALHVRDPRVSEAHAIVSLRDGVLCLLALRGRLRLDGAWCDRVALESGQRVALSPDTTLLVESVRLPAFTWTARFDTESVALDRPRCWSAEKGWVSRGFNDADLRFWPEGDRWFWDRGAPPAFPLRMGTLETQSGPLRIEQTAIPTLPETEPDPHHGSLEIVAAYDVVHFRRAGQPCGSIGGLGARLISELVLLKNARWTELAGLLWTGDASQHRSRLDNLIWRTRRRLSALGVDGNLLSADNSGHYFLHLSPSDIVIDET